MIAAAIFSKKYNKLGFFLCTWFLIFTTFSSFAQSDEIKIRESEQEFVFAWSDTTGYSRILKVADSLARRNPEKAIRLYRTFKEKAEQNSAYLYAGQSAFSLGQVYYYRGEYLSAGQELKTALAYFDRYKLEKEVLKTLNLLGSAYALLEQPDKALPYYNRLLDVRYQKNDTVEIAKTLIILGSLYKKSQKPDKTLELLKVARDIYLNRKSLLELASVYDQMAEAHIQLKQYEEARDLLNMTKDIKETAGDSRGLYVTLRILAELYEKTGEWESEMSVLQQTALLASKINDRYEAASNEIQLCDLLVRLGKATEAERRLKEVKLNAKIDGFKNVELEATRLLSIISKKSGNYVQALQYLEEYTRIESEQSEKKLKEQVAFLEYALDKQKSDTQFEISRRELGFREKEKDQAETIRSFIILLSLTVIVMVFILVVYFRINRRLKIKLFETEDRFRAVENTPFIGVLVHENGRILDCNQEFLRMVRSPREQVLTKNIMEFLFKDRTFKTGRSQFKVRSDANQSIDVLIFEREIMYKGKKVKLASLSDISKIKDVEKELTEVKLASEKLSESKSQFLANMSHEIRTPLNGIIAGLDLLKKEKVSPEGLELIAIIKDSSDNLLTLINDILDLNKVEAGKLDLKNKGFNLGKLIKETKELTAIKAQQKGLKLNINLNGEINTNLYGDPLRLKQILNNLLSNALKFTNEGQLTLEIKSETVKNNLKKIYFSVQDTGIGIKKEDQRRIFETFMQADLTSSKKYGGSGLGLSITKRLVEMMGGELSFRSNVGQGSVFYFTLEMREVAMELVPDQSWAFGNEQWEEEASSTKITVGMNSTSPKAEANKNIPTAANKAPEKVEGSKPYLVLLAEDNKMNQKLVQIFFQRLDVPLEVAEDGKKAVEMYENGNYDMVLMDVQMPTMDGLEATKSIRKLERKMNRGRTPIIALTANAMQGDRETCMEAGMDDFISKPFKKEELADILKKYVIDKKKEVLPEN